MNRKAVFFAGIFFAIVLVSIGGFFIEATTAYRQI